MDLGALSSKLSSNSGAVHSILTAILIKYYCCQTEFVPEPAFTLERKIRDS